MGILLKPTICRQTQSETWLDYAGNYKRKRSFPDIILANGVYAYFVDLSGYDGGTTQITVNSSRFGFNANRTGGTIRLLLKLPEIASNIPTISFGSNITFADFEEIDRWEEGCIYCLDAVTNNGGSKWIVSNVEVYQYPQYFGNLLMNESDSSIVLEEGVGVYLVDLSESTNQTETITIDSTGYGFTANRTGGECTVILKLPTSNIPTISLGSNITFADFEDVDRWEEGCTYILKLRTNNSGTNWTISETEVY